ncbi:MAG TPA: DUF998 domain-containing protein [Anaerolineales bacterium]|nr:DUF998 domain-containing protein [Anaerolineales bacterium]
MDRCFPAAMSKSRLIKLAALTGLIGPLLFAVVIVGLTIVQADFMRTLGWDPFGPVIDWPSGLALGPYGWLLTVTFPFAGAAMLFFAYGLRLVLREKLGTTLLMLAGCAMMGLVFTTDPTLGAISRTWHGILHDAFFVLLGLTLMPAILVLGFVFWRNAQWKDLAIYTWCTVALAVPTFWLKGVAFYVFLLAILVWNEVIAMRLKSMG